MKNMRSPEQIAAIMGCSPDQVRAQFAKNAKQLQKMADKGEATGTKQGEFTPEQLRMYSAACHMASKTWA